MRYDCDWQSNDLQGRKRGRRLLMVVGTCLLVCFFYPPAVVLVPLAVLGYYILRGTKG